MFLTSNGIGSHTIIIIVLTTESTMNKSSGVRWLSVITGLDQWTGPLDWTTGLTFDVI